MATTTNQYKPDYTVPPGWVVGERLAAHDISQAELARRCGRSPKLISEIIAGKAPIEPITAIQFEKVLGVDASIWLGLEAEYRLRETRENEAQEAAREGASWSSNFPMAELAERGAIRKPSSTVEAVSELLAFFGVASTAAWQAKYGASSVAFRHSPSFKSSQFALAAWLRLAEVNAREQDCAEYNSSEFKSALTRVRRLTRTDFSEALDAAQKLCNDAGVALALVKPLAKTRLSGAAWWVSPRRPLIALSARHKTDDHLWFSLFHEAAHILLHSRKSVFVDGVGRDGNDIEAEADNWAAKFLVPTADWRRFTAAGRFNRASVKRFANEQNIAPGIVVGSLQHNRLLRWNQLNNLKVRLEWRDA
ncbi:MAG: ImmA/IrrE family metallo-endopeptidase [Gammaproteobacteria bacterium]|nr:ImmA/IrrE family metallo-endopeptidase [Gammaproteobacteria bacterium]